MLDICPISFARKRRFSARVRRVSFKLSHSYLVRVLLPPRLSNKRERESTSERARCERYGMIEYGGIRRGEISRTYARSASLSLILKKPSRIIVSQTRRHTCCRAFRHSAGGIQFRRPLRGSIINAVGL